MITITDVVGDDCAEVTVEPDAVADAIRPWYPGAPSEVDDAIVKLQAALIAGEPTGELQSYLGLRISDGPRCFFGRTSGAIVPCEGAPATQWVVYSTWSKGREVVTDREPVCDDHAEDALSAARATAHGPAVELQPIDGRIYLPPFGLSHADHASLASYKITEPLRRSTHAFGPAVPGEEDWEPTQPPPARDIQTVADVDQIPPR